MRRLSFTDEKGRLWERVSKKTARTAYNNNLRVLFIPCNLRPFGVWHPEMITDKAATCGEEFEKLTNSMMFYNCINGETGRYLSYYIPVRYTDRFNGMPVEKDAAGAVKEYDYSVLDCKMVASAFYGRFKGLADSIESEDRAVIDAFVWDHLQKGMYCAIDHCPGSFYYDPEKFDETTVDINDCLIG